jgi:hypothetical protein
VSPTNLSMRVPIPEGLRLDLFAKYTTPSTLSSNYLNISLRKFMSEVTHVSRSHESPQEENEVLKKSLVTPILR